LFSQDTYVTEAIALYDYIGRSEKELSFKKGSILAIRGQLSTDWWQGSLVPSGANSSNFTPRVGYIPDKYIALSTSSSKN
jgi:SLIT-ROBO Rho GTPase activating protein